ncbi:MAG: universal stress protein [Oligosphaeraceae bacterium]|nr:universal stress protein [Oligosphaeraceae bacterium]
MMFFRKKTSGEETKKNEAPAAEFTFIQKALLVVDGSKPSLEAADFAVNFARQTGCELVATFVVDTATLDYLQQMRIFVSEERQELEQDLERKGRRYLDTVQELGQKHNLYIATHMCHGRFHQTALKLARELEVDLLIIGGWKYEIKQKDSSSVERQLIMDLAECPVIVVKKCEEHK